MSDASVGHVIATLPAENVFELGFSPLGSFIITWQRPSKDDNGDAIKNLKVWTVLGGGTPGTEADEHTVVGRFVQKSQTGWNLQYTFDEQYCARVVTNEIQFYRSEDLGTVWKRLRVEGVSDFAVSPGKNHAIAVFVPERKVRERERYFRGMIAEPFCRASRRLSKFTMYPSSMVRFLRKISSRETKYS